MITKQDPNRTSALMLVVYFSINFAFTWAFLFPATASGSEQISIPFLIIAAFGPFLAAVATQSMFKGKKPLVQWLRKVFNPRVPLLLYLAGALLLPLVFGGLHFLLYRALGGTVDFSAASPWYTYPAYLIPTALLTGGNEEPGWRGFALPGLLQWFHPIITALILGLIHAAWHLPLLNHYQTTFGIYAFNVVGLTFLLNWFYMKSKGSVLPVMLLHAATNVVGEFIPMPIELLGGTATFMVLRGAVYWAIAVTLIVITKGRLGCEKQIQLSGPDRKQKPIRKTAR